MTSQRKRQRISDPIATPDAETADRKNEKLLLDALHYADSMVMISEANPAHTILYVNDAVSQQLGYDAMALHGKSLKTLEHERTDQRVWRRIERLFSDGAVFAEEVYLRHASGKAIRFFWNASNVHNPDGKGTHLISFQTRCPEEQHAKDPLTGMRSAEGFFERATERLKRAKQQQRKLALFCIGVDEFASIYNEYSPQAADEALMAASTILQEAFRSDDVIGRIKDGTFLVMAQVRSAIESEGMTVRLQQKVEQHNEDGVYEFSLSLSVGFTLANPEDDLDGVISSAEREMLFARLHGKNLKLAV